MKEKAKEKSNKSFLEILKISCIIYSPFTIIINIICALTMQGNLLNFKAIAFIYALCFLTSLILVLKFKKKIEYKPLIFSSCLYATIAFIIQVFVHIIVDGSLWDIKSILLIFAYSVVISILINFVKLKNYILSSLMYYTVSVISFMILTLFIADYNNSNNAMLFFGSFTFIFIIFDIVYYFVKKSFTKYDNEEKPYIRQFD